MSVTHTSLQLQDGFELDDVNEACLSGLLVSDAEVVMKFA